MVRCSAGVAMVHGHGTSFHTIDPLWSLGSAVGVATAYSLSRVVVVNLLVYWLLGDQGCCERNICTTIWRLSSELQLELRGVLRVWLDHRSQRYNTNYRIQRRYYCGNNSCFPVIVPGGKVGVA